MTDREMLELAAKAACLADARWDDFYGAISHTAENGIKDCPWNPLTSDGEALRLAVTLGMRLTMPKYKGFGSSAEHQRDGIAGCTAFRDDPMQQTREAIVRAAAEAGKAMT